MAETARDEGELAQADCTVSENEGVSAGDDPSAADKGRGADTGRGTIGAASKETGGAGARVLDGG